MKVNDKREIERRMSQMPEPTPEQLRKLKERVKQHREKHGTLNHEGLLGNLFNFFR